MQVSLGREPSPLPDTLPAGPGTPSRVPNASTPSAQSGLVEAHGSALPPELLATSVRQRFESAFGTVAADPDAFRELCSTAFGPHDGALAEELRQRACSGDFSFLPRIVFADSATLHGANGAYATSEQTVYLNRDRMGDITLLGDTFIEETGHHLDTLLRDTDAIGDEGEVFRRTLLGERLDPATRIALENEDDHGSIVVTGRTLHVECWSLSNTTDRVGHALGQRVRAVSSAIGTGSSAVGDAATGAARRAGSALLNTASAAGTHAWNTTSTLASGIWGITGGVISALLTEGFAAAWDRFWGGLDAVLCRAPAQGLSFALDVTERLAESAEQVLPDSWLRSTIGNVRARIMDATRSLMMGGLGTVIGAIRNLSEAGSNLGHGADLVRRGQAQQGLKQIARAALEVPQTLVDAVLMAGGKAASAAQTLAFLEAPGRRLDAVEKERLGLIYGDAVDLEQVRVKEGNAGLFSLSRRPFTLGNTIYLKNCVDDPETPEREFLDVLVSEVTHVWQFQNGGSDYVSEALLSQAVGKAYRWAEDAGHTPWAELEPEQQDAFLNYAQRSGAFDSTPPAFPKDAVVPPGMTVETLNAFLTDSLAAIRARRGAP